MRVLSYKVPLSYDNTTVQHFLRSCCKISHRLLVRLKHTPNGITANGKHIRSIDKLRAGDIVELNLPEDKNPAKGASLPLSVLYEDKDLIVLDKPPFMPVHPSRGHQSNTLANAFAAYMEAQGKRLTFRPVNRLDRDTSGIVVVAKHPHSANLLNKNAVKKTYFAICEGILEGSATIDYPIGIKPGHGIMRQVQAGGETAVTHYTALYSRAGHTALKLWLETGRTHQIRVHLSSIGHPLAGDDMYGGSRAIINRQALHCEHVSLIHPISQKRIEINSPLPWDIKRAVEYINR